MTERKNSIVRKPWFRYIFIGGVTYSIEILIIYTFQYLGAGELIAISVAFWSGLTVSFVLQKLIAFENRERKASLLARQTMFFLLLVLVNYVFTLLFVGLFSKLLGVYISRTLALLATTSWNYVIYSRIIFSRDNQPVARKYDSN